MNTEPPPGKSEVHNARNIFFILGYLGTDPTLHTATVANVRSVNYQDTDRELAKLNTTIKEYLSKGRIAAANTAAASMLLAGR